MSKFKKAVLVCLGSYLLLVFISLLSNTSEKMVLIGLIGLIMSVLLLVAGIIACIFPGSREVGKGMLLSAGILLIVGTSVCSFTINMK